MAVQRSTIHQLVRPQGETPAASSMYDVAAIEAVFAQARQRQSSLSLLMLSTADGRSIAEASSLDADGRRIAAMANSFLTLGETVSRELKLSEADYATICTRMGNVVLIRIAAARPMTLTAVGRSELNLAVLLFHARECAQRLLPLLDARTP